MTHPHLRMMSFRSEHDLKMTRDFLRSQLPIDKDVLEKDTDPDAAMVITYDGGKYQGAVSKPRINCIYKQKKFIEGECDRGSKIYIILLNISR